MHHLSHPCPYLCQHSRPSSFPAFPALIQVRGRRATSISRQETPISEVTRPPSPSWSPPLAYLGIFLRSPPSTSFPTLFHPCHLPTFLPPVALLTSHNASFPSHHPPQSATTREATHRVQRTKRLTKTDRLVDLVRRTRPGVGHSFTLRTSCWHPSLARNRSGGLSNRRYCAYKVNTRRA